MRISISSIAADPERKNRAMLEEGRVAGHARVDELVADATPVGRRHDQGRGDAAVTLTISGPCAHRPGRTF